MFCFHKLRTRVNRECDGLEDICKTTVTRQIFFEYDNMGEMVNTTVGKWTLIRPNLAVCGH